MSIFKSVPISLTVLRALLGPVVLALAIGFPSQLAFGICLTLAFLSDVFDGVLARRLGIVTASLRRLDSVADTIFYVCAGISAWLLHQAAVEKHAAALAILLFLEIFRYAFDLFKFHREASYHMWSSKIWGICLFIGFFCLLALGRDGFWVAASIYAGIVADLEGLAISVALAEWRSDVPSVIHALRYRAAQRT